ncbi:MAG TPA: S-methyl-5'-thioadenosine phosphorylase [Anaerolineales bacterium]
MAEPFALGVIGGSGLYDIRGLENTTTLDVDTPFGPTSAPIRVGTFKGRKIAFLARHGVGHRLMPSEVPYRANIFAFKIIGVERIISISACGSLREDLPPGHIVVPDQLLDHTKGRARTFFGDGIVAHLSTPAPFCPELSGIVADAVREAGGTVHAGGTAITIEGPRFSTRAESQLYRSWGLSLIGMTTAPEVFLAREAELCYAVMAHVTDYDVWHASEAPVTVEAVVRTLEKNTTLAQAAIQMILARLGPERHCDCPNALAGAIITRPDAIPPETLQRLAPLVRKYIPV